LTEFTQTLKIEKRNNLNSEKSTKWQQRIKIIAILCLNKGSCVFATSEFPAEIPRTQTRNYSYTKPLGSIADEQSKLHFNSDFNAQSFLC